MVEGGRKVGAVVGRPSSTRGVPPLPEPAAAVSAFGNDRFYDRTPDVKALTFNLSIFKTVADFGEFCDERAVSR